MALINIFIRQSKLTGSKISSTDVGALENTDFPSKIIDILEVANWAENSVSVMEANYGAMTNLTNRAWINCRIRINTLHYNDEAKKKTFSIHSEAP